MSNTVTTEPAGQDTMQTVNRSLAGRRRAERRFRRLGLAAILISLSFLALLLVSIVSTGYTAFEQTFLRLTVFLDPQVLNQGDLESADYEGLIKASLRRRFPGVHKRRAKRLLYKLVSPGAAWQLREKLLRHPKLIGKTVDVRVPANDDVDMLIKGHIDRNLPESVRRLRDI